MALGALGADVEFSLVDLTSGPATNRRVLIAPVEMQGAANKLPLMDLAPRVSDADGRCWVSNMVAGLYSVTVQGPPSTTRYQILVPETNGVLNARSLLVGSTNVPGVGVAYTAAASDARYPLRTEVNTGEGISLAQATAAAAAVVETNTTAVTATLQAEINTASNAAYTAAAGLDAARRAEIYSASNAVIATIRSDAREWNVKQFGAKGDGVLVNQTATIAGSKFVTFNAAEFTTNDIGKTISIVEAGADGLNLTTTIESVSGPTAITVVDAAYSAVLDRTSVYGTDDTLPIQAGMDTTGTNGGGTLSFPAGIYIVAGALRDVGAGLHHNAQLWFPELPPVGQTSTRIKLAGPISPSLRQFAVVPSQRWGIVPGAAVLWSTLVTTNGRMMHCANYTASSYTSPTDSTVKFNAVTVEIRNLHFRVVPNPGLTALDLTGAVTSHIENVVVDTGWQEYAGPQPTNTTSRGIWMPHTSNAGGGSMVTRNTIIGGFYTGIQFQEHSLLENVTTYGCWYGYYPAFGGHSMKMVNCNAEGCKYQMISRDYASIIDAELSIENSLAGWWAPGYLLDDNGALGGELRYQYTYQTAALPLTNTVNAATPGRFLDIIQWRPYMKPRYPLVQATNLTGTIDIARLPAIPISGVTGLQSNLTWLAENTGAGGGITLSQARTEAEGVVATNTTALLTSINTASNAAVVSAKAITDAADAARRAEIYSASNTVLAAAQAALSAVDAALRQEIEDTTLDLSADEIGNVTNWAKVAPADWRESKAAKTLVVDADNGSDVTGARGRLDKPYASLAAASGASDPGDVILLRPGSNYVASSVWLKTNVTVRGFGAASRIYGDAAQTNQAVLAVTNSGVTIEDVLVSASGTAIGYIGTTGNLAYATNVALRNVYAEGGLYGVAWAGDYLDTGEDHSVTVLMESCTVYGAGVIGVRFHGHTNMASVRMNNCSVTGNIDAVILGGCVAVIEGGRYVSEIDGITTGHHADVTVRGAYVRGLGSSSNADLFNDGYPTSILREDGVDYITPGVDEDYDKLVHVVRQKIQAGEVRTGSLVVSNGIAATNLTGTIDAARFPPSVTNSIVGGINLSNPAVCAIYMLSITEPTTLSAFGNMHASEFRTAQLWITNGSGSTYTLTLPAGTRCPDGNPLYVTNGQRRVVSIGGLINFTNAISRALP